MTVAQRKIDFTTLVVLGPLKAQRWRFEDPACPWPITAELWRREDGQQLMEVSIKAPIVQAAAAIGGFMAYLAEVGAERDDSEQTKTRWALGYYAAKLTRNSSRRGATGKTAASKKAAGKRSAATKQRMRVARVTVAKAPRKAAAANAARKRAGHPATGKTSRRTPKKASRRR